MRVRLHLRPGPSVGDPEPASQQVGRFVGRLAVERHQRAGAALSAPDLRAPLVAADARHLDVVRAAIDRLVKAVDVHG